MPAVSKKQQRFFGMVRAAQKGEGATSPEVAKVADEISNKDAKKFAKTKHKGLPEKKKMKEETSTYEKLKKKIGSKEKHDKAVSVDEGVMDIVKRYGKKKEEKKPQKAMDAGARGRRMLKRREHAKYVSGSTENVPDSIREGSLHKWFKGSKSKDGKGGWVNVVTGGTCASDEPGEGTPKCVSSSKRASMTKAERESASRRKKAAEPGQQSKSGAAKPTYVKTDSKKKMKESKDLEVIAKELDGASKMHKKQAKRVRKHIKDMHTEAKKPKNCGCGQDPCITYGKKEKVDEACWKGYKAYGMKKKGGKMVPNCKPVGSVKKEEVVVGEAKVEAGRSNYGKASVRNKRRFGKEGEPAVFDASGERGKMIDKKREEHKAKRGVKEEVVTEADKKGKGSGKKDACYHKVKASASVWPSAYASGRLVQCRKKGAANYGNSKKESYSWRDELEFVQEGAAWTKKSGKNKEGGLNEKGRKSYERENPGSDLKAPQPEGGSRKKSFCARMGGMKKKLTSAKTANDPDSRINKALRKWKC